MDYQPGQHESLSGKSPISDMTIRWENGWGYSRKCKEEKHIWGNVTHTPCNFGSSPSKYINFS